MDEWSELAGLEDVTRSDLPAGPAELGRGATLICFTDGLTDAVAVVALCIT